MEVRKATNWGWGFYTSVLLLIAAICDVYIDYRYAIRKCYGCFEDYDFITHAVAPIVILWGAALITFSILRRYVFPKIQAGTLGIGSVLVGIVGLAILVGGGVAYAYLMIKLRNENNGDFGYYPQFRSLYIAQVVVKAFAIISIFELILWSYSSILTRYKENGNLLLRALSEFIFYGSWAILLLNAIIPLIDVLNNNDANSAEKSSFITIAIALIIVHLYWFYRGIQLIKSLPLQFKWEWSEFLLAPFLIFIALGFFAPIVSELIAAIFALILILTLGIISAYLRWSLQSEKLQLQTQVSQTSAELSSLRAQINPHFLFNALNTLYAIAMKENSEKTADGIQKLGDMMRFMLQENHQSRIPLAKEIEYLQNFIDIQRMRLDENQEIDLKINLQQTDREVFIAPMLLNPLVENAFKHGISFRSASWIYITLTHDPSRIFFKVHNSYHPKAEEDPEKDSHGIGLENVKKRLELLYPGRHQFDVQASENDYFVSLILKITP
jgi:two-component system, LytTR family, sensor kinase